MRRFFTILSCSLISQSYANTSTKFNIQNFSDSALKFEIHFCSSSKEANHKINPLAYYFCDKSITASQDFQSQLKNKTLSFIESIYPIEKYPAVHPSNKAQIESLEAGESKTFEFKTHHESSTQINALAYFNIVDVGFSKAKNCKRNLIVAKETAGLGWASDVPGWIAVGKQKEVSISITPFNFLNQTSKKGGGHDLAAPSIPSRIVAYSPCGLTYFLDGNTKQELKDLEQAISSGKDWIGN